MKQQLRRTQLTQAAFGVIIAFLVTQVAWWLYFQADYVGEVTANVEAVWRDDAAMAQRLYEADPVVTLGLLASYPHLRLEGGRVVLDEARLAAFAAEQRSTLRMFRHEGAFFLFVVLAGLLVLARSLAAARELERRQHNFLLAVTHEFKTPISTMRLLVETLQYRSPTPERLTDYLRRMERELTRLQRSSEQVLASARLEQIAQVGEVRREDLEELVPAVLAKVRGAFEARGALITFEAAGEPLAVRVHAEGFELVLTNLLDNAVKYTPAKEKPVVVRLARRGDLAELTVEDEGVGVPPEEAERVFERFYRPGSEMTRRSQGVGLGLYLVRSNVELMGGEVVCRPRSDGRSGARFVVRLPLAKPDATAAADRPAARRATQGAA